jgi:hypothetical protein
MQALQVGMCVGGVRICPLGPCCGVSAENDPDAQVSGPLKASSTSTRLMEYRGSRLHSELHNQRMKTVSSFHFSPGKRSPGNFPCKTSPEKLSSGKLSPGNLSLEKFRLENFILKNLTLCVAGQTGAAGSRKSVLKNFSRIGTFVT